MQIQLGSRVPIDGRSIRQSRLFRLFWQLLVGHSKCSTKIDQDQELRGSTQSALITDCRGLYDAVNRSQTAGLGLTEKRTAIEALSIRQICEESNVCLKWVNSDRQLADILTKIGVLPDNLDRVMATNKWKIVFDSNFTSAKNVRKQIREKHFKNKAVKVIDEEKDDDADEYFGHIPRPYTKA